MKKKYPCSNVHNFLLNHHVPVWFYYSFLCPTAITNTYFFFFCAWRIEFTKKKTFKIVVKPTPQRKQAFMLRLIPNLIQYTKIYCSPSDN